MLFFIFFSVLKQATKSNLKFIYIKPTKTIIQVVRILYKLGYISGFSLLKHTNLKNLLLKVYLKNTKNKNTIHKICNFTCLNKRSAIGLKDLWFVSINSGVFLINTTIGVLSIQEAKKIGVGGVLMFYIL